jgi:hypothetical protein
VKRGTKGQPKEWNPKQAPPNGVVQQGMAGDFLSTEKRLQ